MIVYDVTNRDSFKNVEMWMGEADKYAVADVNRLLIGNKIDVAADRQVTTAEGAALAKKLKVKFVETSAKDSVNVQEAFKTMAGEMLTRMTKKQTPKPLSSSSSKTSNAHQRSK